MDIMLLKVSCPLFLAVAACTLKLWMVNLLRIKEESFGYYRFLSSANDKRIRGNYRVRIHSAKCGAWYMKII